MKQSEFYSLAGSLLNSIEWGTADDHISGFLECIDNSIPHRSCQNCGQCGDFPFFRTKHAVYPARIEKLCNECVSYLSTGGWDLEYLGIPARA